VVKCLNCGKEVKQHDGKRHKLYCNEACRKAYARKMKADHNKTFKETVEQLYPDTISGQTITGQALPDTPAQMPKCKYCGADLQHLKQVCCGPCAWARKGEHNPVSKSGVVEICPRHAEGLHCTKCGPAEGPRAKQIQHEQHGHPGLYTHPGFLGLKVEGGLQKVETPQAGGRRENDK